MARTNPARSFIVGETVHLTSRVSEVGGKTPVDPDLVALTSLKHGTTETITDPVPFTRTAEGQFTHVIQTASMAPGAYTLVVSHSSGPTKITLVSDGFVLQTP